MKDSTDADQAHAKRVCKDFEIKNFEEYHHLYVQSNTSLLADLFENFEIYVVKYMNLTLLIFLLPGLAWQAALKKQSKIRPFCWYQYVINDRKRYQSRNMSHSSSK